MEEGEITLILKRVRRRIWANRHGHPYSSPWEGLERILLEAACLYVEERNVVLGPASVDFQGDELADQ